VLAGATAGKQDGGSQMLTALAIQSAGGDLCTFFFPRVAFAAATVNSWVAAREVHANLATLHEAPGVLDAAAFAIILCGSQTLLISMESPPEKKQDDANKGQVLARSSPRRVVTG
jgi:hypothetical protein